MQGGRPNKKVLYRIHMGREKEAMKEGVSFQEFYGHLIEWDNFGKAFGQLWGSSKTPWRQFWDNLETTLYL